MIKRPGKIPTAIWLAVAAAALIVAVVVYVRYFSFGPAELPQRLGDAQLRELIDGERANAILDRMHDKEVTPSTNLIGIYGRGNTVVYLSVYRTSSAAEKAYAKMAGSIEKGNLLFSNYRGLRIGDLDVSFCFGQEQDHYFFPYRNRLYWLAADTPVAEKMANELIDGL